MRTHGWQGEPPRSDEDAVARIVAAADRCVRRRGGQTTIADVAAELGVSRKTVYRYFPSTTALLRAVATEGTRKFLEAMAERLSAIDDIAEAVVEGVVLTVTAVPDEPYLQLLLEEPSHALLRSITSETARRVGQQVLVEHTSVDWERTPMASRPSTNWSNGRCAPCTPFWPTPAIRRATRTSFAATCDAGWPRRSGNGCNRRRRGRWCDIR